MSFSPMVGLSGFRVASSFDITELECKELSNEVRQLGLILYPPELINEKFLIKMRECVMMLAEGHPLKRWLKALSTVEKRTLEEQEIASFLSEVLNSRFNLITELEVRSRIINILIELPQKTLGERLLKSYLYLIIGNITKSDNLLLEFINRRPIENWKGYTVQPSFYHLLAAQNMEQILAKLAKHPADRKIYLLFTQYLLNYYNNAPILGQISDHQGAGLSEKIDLKYIEKFAPALVRHLRLLRENETGRALRLMGLDEYPMEEQAYWHRPFIETGPVVSVELLEELKKIEQEDELWFLYLMDNEKLVDAYLKKTGKGMLPGRREYLHGVLGDKDRFMLAIYKLIELGDINESLVLRATEFVANE